MRDNPTNHTKNTPRCTKNSLRVMEPAMDTKDPEEDTLSPSGTKTTYNPKQRQSLASRAIKHAASHAVSASQVMSHAVSMFSGGTKKEKGKPSNEPRKSSPYEKVDTESPSRSTGNENEISEAVEVDVRSDCLLYTSPSPRDLSTSRMPSSA